MEFRIADTFTDSLAKLTGQEQKAVKTTAFDLQLDPSNPGLRFHKLDRAKDPKFWSVRVSADIRLIVHKTAASLLLAYVGHHDAAYKWAERRKIVRHPKTGAAQLVEVRETVEEIRVHRPVEVAAPVPEKPLLFANVADDDLLGYGVPSEWLDDVKKATEDTLFDLADHLPQEASEALLDLATGVTPQVAAAPPVDADPFSHPDAQRRFRILTNVEELERALEFPWEKWTVFLHPAQRRYVERAYNGPARISGSAGTGKTIVALHRAVFLARKHEQAHILLTTFSKTLANALKTKLDRLIGNEPGIGDRIHVHAITGIGYETYAGVFGQPNIASPALIQSVLKQAADADAGRFTPQFLFGEWTDVVDAWQLKTWEEYRDVARLGRKTRIGGKQREVLWSIFERVRAALTQRKVVTWPDVFGSVASHLAEGGNRSFDFAVVDEAQDMGIAEVRFLAALGSGRADSLFFAGDLGQRIFQQPFSWKSLGVDVRGRSHTLRINYRTSHQIRSHADRLLPSSLADVDGNVESRRGTVSVFNGPPPRIDIFDDADDEASAVGQWIGELLENGFQPHEIGVFVRAVPQVKRAKAAVKASGAKAVELGDKVETTAGHVAVSTMHLAKGLEFRAVAVMACDDEIVPLQERIETVSDDSDLEEVY
ncbi:MAG: UvrD-helicase domain-containing protein, partial [Planctomycetes bacterium]|nr:UvrD-helicase domain-containing protein [Planctomycetota bacterium]